MKKVPQNLLPIAMLLLVVAGCSRWHDEERTLTLATTTSTRDSELLDELIPMFEKQTGITVKVIAVGSGQALELGRRGDADVLLTHAPEAEQAFMNHGHGEDRRPVMSNDFILVGPMTDPVRISEVASITEAFRQIARAEAPFVSRGDESGTHMQEKMIWKSAGIQPEGEWYLQTGSGMGEALRISDQKQAYTLSDRATFLAQSAALNQKVIHEGDPLLRNRYSVLIVSSQKHPHIRQVAARRFVKFLLSAEAKKTIKAFGVEKYGQPLFFVDQGE